VCKQFLSDERVCLRISSALRGLFPSHFSTHGLRGGLHSSAPSGLKKKTPGFFSNPGVGLFWLLHAAESAGVANSYWMVTFFGFDEIPLATTKTELAPVSVFAGATKLAETVALPVAIPMVLKFEVRA
jgi:hypothetical protein